jgi:hypothetical protein
LPLEEPEVATAGLAEQVEQRAELRQLVADVRDLPDEQRAALLLAEVGGLAQRDIASVLGCEVARVKALVYRARSALVARREARELPCEEIREQLANLRGGSLRRSELRLHLRECPGCRDFREQVRRQRQMLSLALPVAPTLGLKTSVLAAVGIGGGAAGGGAAAAGGAAAGGGAAAIAKVAAVAAIAVGGVAGGAAVVEHERHAPPSPGAKSSGEGVGGADAAADSPPASGGPSAPVRGATDGEPRQVRSGRPNERSGRHHERAGRHHERSGRHHGHSGHGVGRPMPSKERTHRPTPAGEAPPGQLKREGGRGQGNQSELEADHGNGRGNGRGRGGGPADSPPVRRGPPEAKVKPQKTKGEPKGSSGLGQASEPQNSQGGDSEAED